ncbi:hypothetical protein [Fodinibius saliphilus]|uniref:hypothetical protein n=1 Tax=Fodinibius saliphilus TaxID=1920650 RepID=UPI00110893D1|nr:hypothetical protein [Fodinibius saliphilus]
MKRSLSLLSVIAFLLAFSSNAIAQTEVTASATIDATINATVNSNVQFGSFSSSQNVDATIDPTGSNSNVGTGTVSNGNVHVQTSGGQGLSISWSATDLTDGSGNTLTYNETVYGNSSDTDDASSASELSSGDTATATSNGNYYIYVGGTIPGNSINGATGGSYDGNVTLTIATN